MNTNREARTEKRERLWLCLVLIALSNLAGTSAGAQSRPPARPQPAAATRAAAIPRTADGKPNLQGIWQVRNRAAYDLRDHHARYGMPPGTGVIEGGDIPYLPAAAAQRALNFLNRQTADPLAKCYMPGVPRIMYMEHPFQIFQTPNHLAITFEWSQVFRLIYTDGSKHPDSIDFWMGDSRGRWDGDTLVVEVTNHNDKTWFDMAGDFHSEALRLVERYTLLDANTIDYEVTFEDPTVFARPWKIRMPLYRQTGMKRLLEYQCEAELEEATGAFERDQRTWYPDDPAAQREAATIAASMPMPQRRATAAPQATAAIPRMADGKPDLQGYVQADAGGANYGLQKHPADFLTPPSRGVVIDPPDGRLPLQPWATAEQKRRDSPERGYDDPTAHCFVAGVPRSMYTPSPYFFIQTPEYIVMLFERMAWRIVPLDGRPHLPDHVRLWQGDSVGHWDGDTLVVETTNLNGKIWLNEIGEIVSHAERVTERFTPTGPETVQYEGTVTDPIVYTAPWTISFALKRQKEELLEVACHEDNQDLQHLKDVRDAARGGKTK
jgi:hypothetical protein